VRALSWRATPDPAKLQSFSVVVIGVAAGIDIGSGSHFLAVRADVDERPVCEFLSFTEEDLEALAQWLTQCGVDVVAMESTGVDWMPLYELLESRGYTVNLVNSRHVKNVSGRKSDVLDRQWLQQLMSYGLLSGGVPTAGGDLRVACGGAAAGHACAVSSEAYPTHAKSADTDERAAR
jgi:hypothetical protein